MRTLRQWRLNRLLSIDDFAAKAGVSNKTIVDIEHGRVTPKLRTIRRITESLGVEPGAVTEFALALGLAPEHATGAAPKDEG